VDDVLGEEETGHATGGERPGDPIAPDR
jgi:hypothetical protein